MTDLPGITSAGAPPAPSAVQGLHRTDPRGPGITRLRTAGHVGYVDPSGSAITDPPTLARIRTLAVPPAWRSVWISPDPASHIQATGVDRAGRTQYRHRELWRERRDAEKFEHMLRFAGALPALRAATLRDLRRHDLDRRRVAASAVRLIDLGLFRLGGERYADRAGGRRHAQQPLTHFERALEGVWPAPACVHPRAETCPCVALGRCHDEAMRPAVELDLRGSVCPGPTGDTLTALKRLRPGEALAVLCDYLPARSTIPPLAEQRGCTWRITEDDGTLFRMEIVKGDR